MYLPALFLAKTSVLCLEMRLGAERNYVWSAKACVVFSAIMPVAAVFMVSRQRRVTTVDVIMKLIILLPRRRLRLVAM